MPRTSPRRAPATAPKKPATPKKKPATPKKKPATPKKMAAPDTATTKKKPPALRPRELAPLVSERLALAIPTPIVELDFQDAWQLVVATILAAQSTDKTINRLTPALFARYPTPAALGAAPQEDVEALVKQSGFFRNKARAIRDASRMIAERFGGEAPRTLDELVQLPGVARKTANVVLSSAYRITAGIIVDTHAGRVSRRLRLTRAEDPVEVEEALMKLFPREQWMDLGHRLVLHGRYVCQARAARCAECPLTEVCPSAEAVGVGEWMERARAEQARVESRGEA